MTEIHKEVKSMLTMAKKKQKEFYDKGVRESPEFKIGDRVWLSRGKIITERTSLKLDHRRLGPYKVTERVGSLAYRLDLPQSMNIHPVFHVSRLSPVVEDTIPGRTPDPVPPVVTLKGKSSTKSSTSSLGDGSHALTSAIEETWNSKYTGRLP